MNSLRWSYYMLLGIVVKGRERKVIFARSRGTLE
jgi:hypothetical protein